MQTDEGRTDKPRERDDDNDDEQKNIKREKNQNVKKRRT